MSSWYAECPEGSGLQENHGQYMIEVKSSMIVERIAKSHVTSHSADRRVQLSNPLKIRIYQYMGIRTIASCVMGQRSWDQRDPAVVIDVDLAEARIAAG